MFALWAFSTSSFHFFEKEQLSLDATRPAKRWPEGNGQTAGGSFPQNGIMVFPLAFPLKQKRDMPQHAPQQKTEPCGPGRSWTASPSPKRSSIKRMRSLAARRRARCLCGCAIWGVVGRGWWAVGSMMQWLMFGGVVFVAAINMVLRV